MYQNVYRRFVLYSFVGYRPIMNIDGSVENYGTVRVVSFRSYSCQLRRSGRIVMAVSLVPNSVEGIEMN